MRAGQSSIRSHGDRLNNPSTEAYPESGMFQMPGITHKNKAMTVRNSPMIM
ncbi:MAG: hypothetical protein IJS05_00860 [Paludibacteraceae bacterium]|nr:hypothetical protein [Paludibacteraceae bacterium]